MFSDASWANSGGLALVEVFTGMINDCFPSTKKRKWLITLLTCGGCQLAALLMVTYVSLIRTTAPWVFAHFPFVCSTPKRIIENPRLQSLFGR